MANTPLSKFTARELEEAVRRELGFRRRVYPGWVMARRYTQAHADRQIAMFEQLAKMLETMAEAEEAKGRLL